MLNLGLPHVYTAVYNVCVCVHMCVCVCVCVHMCVLQKILFQDRQQM